MYVVIRNSPNACSDKGFPIMHVVIRDSRSLPLGVYYWSRLKDHREQILKHQRINHPAGRKQLEEVWDKQDGLTQEKFDPKTFFFLHGKPISKHIQFS